MQGSGYIPDPERALWPVVPANKMTKTHEVAAKIHAAVLDYHEHIEPFTHELLNSRDGVGNDDMGSDGNLWTEHLHSVHIKEGKIRRVRLGKLQEQWAAEQVSLEFGVDDGAHGERVVEQPRRVLLPLAAARKCHRQLNQCVEVLNLAVQIDPTPLGVSGKEDAALVEVEGDD